MARKILALGICLLCTSCAYDQDEEKSASARSFELTLSIIDSIEVPVQGRVLVHDYAPARGLYAASLSPSQEVLLFDQQGKIAARFERQGAEPGQFEGEIAGLHFVGDSLIVVLAKRGYYVYDWRGAHRRTILHPENAPYGFWVHQLATVRLHDDSYLLANFNLLSDYPVHDPRYYATVHPLTAVSLSTGRYQGWLSYPPEGAYRASEEGFLPSRQHYFAFDAADTSLWVLAQAEPKLRQYRLQDSFSLQAVWPTRPQHWTHPRRLPFGPPAEKTFEQSLRDAMTEAAYRHLWQLGDTLMTIYETGVAPEVARDVSIPDYHANSHRLNRYYFQLLVNGTPIAPDIVMPLKVRWPTYVHHTRRILFTPETREMTTEPAGARLYVGAMRPVEK